MKEFNRKYAKEILDNDEIIICICPGWCESGYMVGKYDHSEMLFDYDECPNDSFDDYVTGFYRVKELNK